MPAQTSQDVTGSATQAQAVPVILMVPPTDLPGEQPVLVLLYDGHRLVDARWMTRAEVTAILAGSQLAATTEN